jgi:hypothetical protein
MAELAVSKSQHLKSKRTLLDMMRESKWLFMGLFIGPAILLNLIVVVVPMLYSF